VRPVNLIPPEERRGDKTPLRTGPLPYVIVAVLAVALAGVTLIVLTGNQISDRKAEVASLQSQVDQTQAEAKKLESFTSFASLQQARQETVASLATSRFDWERVLRELAIVIPGDVWLTELTASATPGASSGSSASTEGIEGPSLDIQGCAAGHDAVAGFLAALRDIDGVTRVSVLSSDRQETSGSGGSTASSTGSATGGGGACASRSFIATFEVLVAFDNAQPAAAATGAPTAAPTTATSSTSTTPTTTTSTDQTEISDAQQQLQQQKDSAAQKTEQGRKAVGTFIPGTGSTP
jgi:Tfp pilus assembly protein PilN